MARGKTYTILMTCVGGELATQTILCLRASQRHQLRVVGVDASESATGRRFVDAFFVVPRGSEPTYPDRIVEIVREQRVDLLLPTSDEEALALVPHRARLADAGCKLACAETDTVRTLSSKERTYRWLDDHGVATPKWVLAKTLDEVRAAAKELIASRGDVVVKPAENRGGRGAIIVRSDVEGTVRHAYTGSRETHASPQAFIDEILPRYEEFLPAIVMQRLRGVSCDIDLLGWEGRPMRIVPRRRINPVRPYEGNEILDAPELIALGSRLVEVLNLSWLYDCDAMYDDHGKPFVIEINPRPSGSVCMPVVAGIPLLDDLISLARGEAIAERVHLPAGTVIASYTGLAAAPSMRAERT